MRAERRRWTMIDEPYRRSQTVSTLHLLNLGYLLVLLLLPLVYASMRSAIPALDAVNKHHILNLAWLGSLGGVMASISGLIRHRYKWNPAWTFWYIIKPLNSAVAGVIGYLIYISIVQASVIQQSTSVDDLRAPTILGIVIAFALGYREDIFRDLLQRVFELIATAGGADTQAPSSPPDLSGSMSVKGKYVDLTWGHATDNVAVTAYNLYRDGLLYATIKTKAPGPNDDEARICFRDSTDVETGHFYAVTATDAASNESAASGPIWVGPGSGGVVSGFGADCQLFGPDRDETAAYSAGTRSTDVNENPT
jgi:hypothetical protein